MHAPRRLCTTSTWTYWKQQCHHMHTNSSMHLFLAASPAQTELTPDICKTNAGACSLGASSRPSAATPCTSESETRRAQWQSSAIEEWVQGTLKDSSRLSRTCTVPSKPAGARKYSHNASEDYLHYRTEQAITKKRSGLTGMGSRRGPASRVPSRPKCVWHQDNTQTEEHRFAEILFQEPKDRSQSYRGEKLKKRL